MPLFFFYSILLRICLIMILENVIIILIFKFFYLSSIRNVKNIFFKLLSNIFLVYVCQTSLTT